MFRSISKLSRNLLHISKQRPGDLLYNKVNNVSVKYYCSEEEKARNAVKPANGETIFDKIINKQISADLIYEDERCIAFNDVMPQGPVHFLVIPKKRIATLDESRDSDKDLLGHLLLTAKALALARLPKGYRLVINNGPDGCQSVYHLHIHVIGGRQLSWPPG